MAVLSEKKITRLEKLATPNSAYLKSLDKDTRRYMRILSTDFPTWLDDYIATPEMQRLKFIDQVCGVYYLKKLYNYPTFYSVLDHSVACALIVWNFTHDKKQTLAALFHDISTPAFKHCVDFLNGDAATQESTEAPTSEIIGNSEKIVKLLKRDKIKVKQVANYHDYPIADNDSPRLASDRLEYSFMNCHKIHYETHFSLNEIERFYSALEIGKNEDGIEEISFNSLKIAEDFCFNVSKIWHNWCDERYRIVGQAYADLLKIMVDKKELTVKSLYHLTEPEVIEKMKHSKIDRIKNGFAYFEKSTSVHKSDKKPRKKCYFVKEMPIKRRYIDPLVRTETNIDIRTGAENHSYTRLSKISPRYQKIIDNLLSKKYKKYAYFNFSL